MTFTAATEARTPKVSVCVVTFNQAQYIRQCLLSIVTQYVDFDFEIIVGDDCSTDGTASIVKEFAKQFPGRITPVLHDKNIGASDNFAYVHALARGEYVAYVDGDDFWADGKLRQQTFFLDGHPEYAAVYTNAIVVSKCGDELGRFNGKLPETIDLSFLVARGNFLCGSSMLYRKRHQDFMLGRAVNIDYGLHIRLAQCGYLGYLESCLTYYRLHSEGSTVATRSSLVRKLVWDAVDDIPKDQLPLLTYASAGANHALIHIFAGMRGGAFGEAISWIQSFLAAKRIPRIIFFYYLIRLLLLRIGNFVLGFMQHKICATSKIYFFR